MENTLARDSRLEKYLNESELVGTTRIRYVSRLIERERNGETLK